ncbi:MAG: EamA family transporter [Myxococcota bacterium]
MRRDQLSSQSAWGHAARIVHIGALVVRIPLPPSMRYAAWVEDVHQKRAAPVLALAVSAISAAAVLVRMAPDVHPVAVAFWRTGLVGAALAPALLIERPRLRGIDLILIVVAGGLLALHFWLWFASLQLTSVMRSTVLVCLTPVWAGLLQWLVMRAAPTGRFWAGVALALCGVAVMSRAGGVAGSLSGDGLAVVAGMLSAAYLTVGGAVRQRISIGPYGALVCLSCALWLLPVATVMLPARDIVVPLYGYATGSWMALLLMAIGPQLMGHIGLNYAVRYIPAAIVAATLLFEPVGATLLGMICLSEIPTFVEICGGALILCGLAVVTIKRNKRR